MAYHVGFLVQFRRLKSTRHLADTAIPSRQVAHGLQDKDITATSYSFLPQTEKGHPMPMCKQTVVFIDCYRLYLEGILCSESFFKRPKNATFP